jgi:hypothetical protein
MRVRYSSAPSSFIRITRERDDSGLECSVRVHVAITDPDPALRTFPVCIEQGTYVTDITHYVDDQGEVSAEMPREARQLASFSCW